MKPADLNSWKGLASPSNLAIVALVGFLFAGHANDWKMLRRRSSTAAPVAQLRGQTKVDPGKARRRLARSGGATAPVEDFRTKSEPPDRWATADDGSIRDDLD